MFQMVLDVYKRQASACTVSTGRGIFVQNLYDHIKEMNLEESKWLLQQNR